MRRVAATKQLLCHPKLGKTQAQTVISSPTAVRISCLKLYRWFTKAHCSLAAATSNRNIKRGTLLMRIRNHSIFSWLCCDLLLQRTHLTCELLAYASKNVNGDVPSDLQKRRGGKSIYTWPHQSSPWFSTQVLWDQSTRWEEPALPCRSTGIPAGQNESCVNLQSSHHLQECIFLRWRFSALQNCIFMKLAKLHYYSNLLNSLLNNPLITETDQLYISCQALSSV